MAIPSGSGTEVLKRASVHNNSDAYTAVITGVANHIYTVISIVACDAGTAAEKVSIRVDVGGTEMTIITNQDIPADGTFVFSERLVLSGTDKIEVYNTAGNVDWYLSYIDQDWT